MGAKGAVAYNVLYGHYFAIRRAKGLKIPKLHTQNPLDLAKNNSYFQHERDEVLQVITARKITATRAVELGCSSGIVGAKLKKAMGIQHYTGIEFDPAAAKRAAEKLDTVHVADLQKITPADLGITGGVDLLVALDVLEHLYDPWEVLAQWASILVPGGHVVTSIPNIQNAAIILDLLQGRWNYTAEGLLDATHLRFFTIEGIQQLLSGAGVPCITYASASRPHLDLKDTLPEGNTLTLANVTLSNLTRDQIVGLYTFQYIVIGQKPISPSA